MHLGTRYFILRWIGPVFDFNSRYNNVSEVHVFISTTSSITIDRFMVFAIIPK